VEKLSPSRVAALEGRRPYYDELAHPGAGDERPPLETVEELAAEMAAQIRRVHPAGPAVLTGFSFGGVLAFETARRLRAEGYPVEQVVLWDSMCDDLLERRTPGEIVAEQARRLARKFWRTAARGRLLEFLRPEPSPTRRVLWWKLVDRVLPHALLGPRLRGLLPHRDKICLAALRAYHGYEARPYDGDVLLFRCTSHHVGLFHKLREIHGHGWGRHVRGKFTVLDLYCAHEDIMDEPVATVILEKTCRALEEVWAPAAAPRAEPGRDSPLVLA
jgi:thioesterase domain-containing protein